MLRIPRPRTRGDCLEEARPCPWAGCRAHALFEVAAPVARQDGPSRAPGLVLNAPTTGGRQLHLRAGCDDDIVQLWIDEDYMGLLVSKPYSCALDVADQGGVSIREAGEHVGLGERAAVDECATGLRKWAIGIAALQGRVIAEDELPPVKVLAAAFKRALA